MMRDCYKSVETPTGVTLEACAVCGAAGELWRYSEADDAPTTTAVMCSNGEAFGPQSGIVNEGCLLNMPPQEFYRDTIRDAVRFWNEYAKALAAQRRKRNWETAQPMRGESLLRPAISATNPLPPGCYCEPGKCAAPRIMGRQTPCRDPEKRDRPAAQGAGDL